MSLISVERSNDFRYAIIIEIDSRWASFWIESNEPSFVIDVYFEAKTSFKGLAFSLKSAASLSPTFIGGINGIFNHLRKFSI